jgi:hypothetical protein
LTILLKVGTLGVHGAESSSRERYARLAGSYKVNV